MNRGSGEGSSGTPLLPPEARSDTPKANEHEGNARMTYSGADLSTCCVFFWTRRFEILRFRTRQRCLEHRNAPASHRRRLLDRRRDTTVSPIPKTFRPTTERDCNRLITKYGEELVHAVNKNGAPLLCDAIAQKQFACALLLFEQVLIPAGLVDSKTGECQTLKWAIDNQVEVVAKFVLDFVAQQKLPLEQSCDILTKYLTLLIGAFPDLMTEYIKNDKFSFEYGRFTVPRSLIRKNGKYPIAMMTNTPPDKRAMDDSEGTKAYWMARCKEHSNDLRQLSDMKTTVAAKFFCCSLFPFLTEERIHLSIYLKKQDLSIEILESETLKTLVDWWFYYTRHLYYFFITIDSILTLIFTVFSQLYWRRDDIGAAYRPLLLGLLSVSMLLRKGGLFFYWSYARQETIYCLNPQTSLLNGCLQAQHTSS